MATPGVDIELKYGSAGPVTLWAEEAVDPKNAPDTFTAINLASGVQRVAVVVRADRGNAQREYEYSSLDGTSGVTIADAATGKVTWTIPATLYGVVLTVTPVNRPYLCFLKVYVSATQWYAVPESAGVFLYIQNS